MKTLTASTSTIVALDLGKYKSVACLYDGDLPEAVVDEAAGRCCVPPRGPRVDVCFRSQEKYDMMVLLSRKAGLRLNRSRRANRAPGPGLGQ